MSYRASDEISHPNRSAYLAVQMTSTVHAKKLHQSKLNKPVVSAVLVRNEHFVPH